VRGCSCDGCGRPVNCAARVPQAVGHNSAASCVAVVAARCPPFRRQPTRPARCASVDRYGCSVEAGGDGGGGGCLLSHLPHTPGSPAVPALGPRSHGPLTSQARSGRRWRRGGVACCGGSGNKMCVTWASRWVTRVATGHAVCSLISMV